MTRPVLGTRSMLHRPLQVRAPRGDAREGDADEERPWPLGCGTSRDQRRADAELLVQRRGGPLGQARGGQDPAAEKRRLKEVAPYWATHELPPGPAPGRVGPGLGQGGEEGERATESPWAATARA